MSDEVPIVDSPAPVPPPAVAPDVPETPVIDAADQAENDEWDKAADEIFPGLKSGKKKEGEKDESAESKKGDEKKPEVKDPAKKDEGEKDPANDPPEEDDEELPAEDDEPDTSARDTRLAAREAQQQLNNLRVDIRAKMFANAPTELVDHDGDKIDSIDKVMRLINPRTNEQFTQEEAGMWFLAAQQQLNQKIADDNKQIDEIAELNLDIIDQADVVKYNYGELLKAMPELRDELWADYEATLIKDPTSGLIIKAPISLQRFYERNLKPYVDMAAKLEADEAKNEETPTVDDRKPAVDPAKVEADAKAERDKKRADRSDIFGGGKDPEDPEDKEWADAATAVFGPKANRGK